MRGDILSGRSVTKTHVAMVERRRRFQLHHLSADSLSRPDRRRVAHSILLESFDASFVTELAFQILLESSVSRKLVVRPVEGLAKAVCSDRVYFRREPAKLPNNFSALGVTRRFDALDASRDRVRKWNYRQSRL